jgi:hypothetical protein
MGAQGPTFCKAIASSMDKDAICTAARLMGALQARRGESRLGTPSESSPLQLTLLQLPLLALSACREGLQG